MPPKKRVAPLYEHDCRECSFLGSYEWAEDRYDLYTCRQGMRLPTVIARRSGASGDYISGIEVAKILAGEGALDHPLVEALCRALKKGLLSKKEVS